MMHLPISTYQLSDLLRELLVYSIKVFLLLCFVQVAVLIVHKLRLERRERQGALLKSQYLSLMYRVFGDEQISIPKPATPDQFAALTDVCIYLMTGSSPAELAHIGRIVRECGVPAFYGDQLSRSRFWIARYRLIEKLGFLKLAELDGLFRDVIDSRNEQSQVIAKATWALSLICRESDLSYILKRVSAPDFMSAKFNEHLFVNIISAFRERGEVERLLTIFGELLDGDKLPLLVKRDFIEACGGAEFTEARALICSCAERFGSLPEMHIASLRSLQKIGGETLDDFIVAGLADEDWRVRAVAAKSVEKCSGAVVAPLEQALGDQNYYVRLNAALSLSLKGEAGRAALARQSVSRDRFVREVSRYVMRESDLPC